MTDTFIYLDLTPSDNERQARCQEYFAKFESYIQNISKRHHFVKSKITSIQYPTRSDSYNCGVYVLNFIANILQGNTLTILDPLRFRHYLKILIIDNNTNPTGCIYCGNDNGNIFCSNC